MPLILDAARAEFRKMDRRINEMEFKWSEPPVAPAPVPSPKNGNPVPA